VREGKRWGGERGYSREGKFVIVVKGRADWVTLLSPWLKWMTTKGQRRAKEINS
jgi:hypothetical protein